MNPSPFKKAGARIVPLFGLAAALCCLASPALAETALDGRLAREQAWMADGLFLLPHRPSYFLPVAYNANPNNAPFTPLGQELKNTEIKFLFSFKIPVATLRADGSGRMFAAYTQQSYWQAYKRDISSPFRDTNYEPEVFVQFDAHKSLGPLRHRLTNLGAVHQSNGRADYLSRSWNRVYADFVFDRDSLMVSLKPWCRFPEPAKSDNNPSMWRYYGYGELRMVLKAKRGNELSMMFRNNLNWDENKGAVELGWAFPLLRTVKGYVQYFNGYGESLLDYDHPSNRISIGFAFSDWL